MNMLFMGVYLMGVHLMGMHLMGMHIIGVHLMGALFVGVHLMGAPYRHASLIAEIINSRSYLPPKLPVEVTCPEAPRKRASVAIA
jgi:hypothetical protein